jgi:hypothetical protein
MNIKNFLTSNGIDIEFSKTKILFGMPRKMPDSVENFTILISKAFIWQCRFLKKIPNFEHFKHYFKSTLCTLKEMYVIKNIEFLWQPWQLIYLELDGGPAGGGEHDGPGLQLHGRPDQ